MPWVHAAYFCKDMQRLDRTKCWNTIPYGDSNEICRKKIVRSHLQIDFSTSPVYFLVPSSIFSFLNSVFSWFPDFLSSLFSRFPDFPFFISRFSHVLIFLISNFFFDLHLFYFHHFPDFQIFPFFISRYFHFIFFLIPRFFLSGFLDTDFIISSFAAFFNNFFRLLLHEKIWWTWWCTRPTTLCQLRFSAISWKQVCFFQWSCHRGERGGAPGLQHFANWDSVLFHESKFVSF